MTFDTTSKGKPMVRDNNNYTCTQPVPRVQKMIIVNVKLNCQLQFIKLFIKKYIFGNCNYNYLL